MESTQHPNPSKHVGPNTHPIRIGLEALARNGSDDSCTPTCFQTGSIWPKPDTTVSQNEIGFRLVLHNISWEHLGKKCYQVWKWETDTGSRPVAFCQNQAQRFFHTGLLPDQVSLARLDPGWFCTIWSGPSLEEQNQIRCGKSDSAYIYMT